MSKVPLHTLCEEKAQLAVAYETIKSLPPSHSPPPPVSPPFAPSSPMLSPYAVSTVSSTPPTPISDSSGSTALSISRAPNICVEDGRIEFVKDSVDGGIRTNCNSINNNNNNNNNNSSSSSSSSNYRESFAAVAAAAAAAARRHSREEKIDNAKILIMSKKNYSPEQMKAALLDVNKGMQTSRNEFKEKSNACTYNEMW
ncbi:hypothetical protein V9T40_000331 [Parthenolecanium corni]|uniref:Uncharacterized protein n=1 Tax=Parthenolecanium corni TaxID=536013 RepID=A0AAN9Y0C7_9HEMI